MHAAVPIWKALMPAEPRSTTPGAALIAVGVILLLIGIVWMTIIGYYPSQLPVIVIIVAVGALLAWLGQRSYQSAKREIALHRIAQRDETQV